MPISTGAADAAAEPVGPTGAAAAAAPAADAAAAAAVKPLGNADGDGEPDGGGGADASAGGGGGGGSGGGGERGGGVSIYDLYFDAEPVAATAPTAPVRARTDVCMGSGRWMGRSGVLRVPTGVL